MALETTVRAVADSVHSLSSTMAALSDSIGTLGRTHPVPSTSKHWYEWLPFLTPPILLVSVLAQLRANWLTRVGQFYSDLQEINRTTINHPELDHVWGESPMNGLDPTDAPADKPKELAPDFAQSSHKVRTTAYLQMYFNLFERVYAELGYLNKWPTRWLYKLRDLLTFEIGVRSRSWRSWKRYMWLFMQETSAKHEWKERRLNQVYVDGFGKFIDKLQRERKP